MGRKSKSQEPISDVEMSEEQEKHEALEAFVEDMSAPAEEIPPEPPKKLSKAPEPMPEAPKEKHYRVTAVSKFVKDGAIYTLAVGQHICAKTHDMAEIKAQGVALEEI